MQARDAILKKIRQSIGVTGAEDDRRAAVRDRLTKAEPGLIPERGQGDTETRIALFRKMAESVQASVGRVADSASVPEAISTYLRDHNLPQALRTGADPRLAALPFAEKTPALTVASGPSDGSDPVGLSHAFAGVAETGTLVLHSGQDNPTTLNFLPDTHIVVVDAAEIAGDYETVWRKMREQFGKDILPRTVNYVTGPSRSADIEQTMLLGAHGPRALHIVVVG